MGTGEIPQEEENLIACQPNKKLKRTVSSDDLPKPDSEIIKESSSPDQKVEFETILHSREESTSEKNTISENGNIIEYCCEENIGECPTIAVTVRDDTMLVDHQTESNVDLSFSPLDRVENVEENKAPPLDRVENVEENIALLLDRVEYVEENKALPLDRVENVEENKALPLDRVENVEENKALPLDRLENVEENKALPLDHVNNVEDNKAHGVYNGKKLLVLDVNGLLVDTCSYVPYDYDFDDIIMRKAVFKRPYCDDFLKFCFEKFNVGVWTSKTKRNIEPVIDFLFGEEKHKLLFCWDQSHCTATKYFCVEKRYKPLHLKKLKKLWNKANPNLPWDNGVYNESNTLFLDDSPYKAICNPRYTGIFPDTYRFRKIGDNSLGPAGDLRLYLDRLSMAENVQEFVKQNPFGQRAITEKNPSWRFYLKIIEENTSPPPEKDDGSFILPRETDESITSTREIGESSTFACETNESLTLTLETDESLTLTRETGKFSTLAREKDESLTLTRETDESLILTRETDKSLA